MHLLRGHGHAVAAVRPVPNSSRPVTARPPLKARALSRVSVAQLSGKYKVGRKIRLQCEYTRQHLGVHGCTPLLRTSVNQTKGRCRRF